MGCQIQHPPFNVFRSFDVRNLCVFLIAIGIAVSLTGQTRADFIGSVSGSGMGITTGTAAGSGAVSSVQLSWNISQITSGPLSGYWHYNYTFTAPNRNYLNNLIIEVSNNVSTADIQNFAGTGTSQGVANYSSNLPGSMRGISIQAGTAATSTFSFDIDRAPTWGDFYASANGSNGPINLWNTGFLRDDDPVDENNNPLFQLSSYPTAQLADSAFYHGHILRPDTVLGTSGPIVTAPVPPTIVLAATGGFCTFASYLIRLRKRSRQAV